MPEWNYTLNCHILFQRNQVLMLQALLLFLESPATQMSGMKTMLVASNATNTIDEVELKSILARRTRLLEDFKWWKCSKGHWELDWSS